MQIKNRHTIINIGPCKQYKKEEKCHMYMDSGQLGYEKIVLVKIQMKNRKNTKYIYIPCLL